MHSKNVPLNLAEWPYPALEAQLRENLRSLMLAIEATNSISLERLEGVSVVENLTSALKSFDAGYPSDHAAAMRDTVMGRMIMTKRGDSVQGHIFFPGDAALQLANKDAPYHQLCAYMFTHECAHVQDLETRAKLLTTEELLNPPLAQPIALSLQIVWNEYAACRLSAYSAPGQNEEFKVLLQESVTALTLSVDEPKNAFAPTLDGRTRSLHLALNLALPVLQAFAYLLGHCRGTSANFAELVPQNYVLLTSNQRIADAFSNVERHLDLLWQSRSQWKGFEAFENLATAICFLIKVLTGIVIKRGPNRQMSVGLHDTLLDRGDGF